VALSLSSLQDLARANPEPIYWAGPKPDTVYEYRRTSAGVFIRYLPRGAIAGDSTPRLTIATYPMENAYAVAQTGAKRPGSVALQIAGGGIASYTKKHPTNVYLAYPATSFQVEVYAPSPAVARRVAAGGRVQPIVNVPQDRGPVAVSAKQLTSLAASLGQPVYWAGPRKKTTYELWQKANGYIYIRYLPKGVPVGGGQGRYLVVATYPMENAFTVTRNGALKGRAEGEGTVVIRLPEGGIATYTKQHATNVYVAYPGVNVQVEVFNPSPKVTPRLVASGQIVPVG
jgi:hypothetical protein